MVTVTARSRFASLDADAQVRVLVRFGQNLTVAARDTYVPGTDEVAAPAHLRRLNEIQHRLLGHVHALISADRNRYPDDVLLSILLEHDDPTLREQTGSAFSEAIDRWSAV